MYSQMQPLYVHMTLPSAFNQLDDLSPRLVHLLVDLGIKSQDIVPLCFEKSAWVIVRLLGVIKAGAAFVFIDPNGSIHLGGRKGTQVKLKGLCIELGEIERRIANHDHDNAL